jgi:hypothetical protein
MSLVQHRYDLTSHIFSRDTFLQVSRIQYQRHHHQHRILRRRAVQPDNAEIYTAEIQELARPGALELEQRLAGLGSLLVYTRSSLSSFTPLFFPLFCTMQKNDGSVLLARLNPHDVTKPPLLAHRNQPSPSLQLCYTNTQTHDVCRHGHSCLTTPYGMYNCFPFYLFTFPTSCFT